MRDIQYDYTRREIIRSVRYIESVTIENFEHMPLVFVCKVTGVARDIFLNKILT